jgi:hypothetical protein
VQFEITKKNILKMSAEALATLKNISNVATYYFTIVVVPIGIALNIFSAVIFLRKHIRSTNMAFYNQMISITNALTLLYYMLVQQSSIVFNDNFFVVSDWLCKMLTFIRRTIREIEPIIESVMVFDRFVNVYFPFKLRFLQKKKVILAVIVTIFLIYAGISYQNLEYYLSVTYKNNSNGSLIVASKSCTATRAVAIEADFVSALLRSFIPFFIMIVCNLLMMKKLKEKKAIRSTKSRKENQFTRTVMIMNASFLILNFPQAIIYTIMSVYGFFQPLSTPTGQILTFCWNIVYFQTVIHYMFNNYINFKYNSVFKKEVYKLLRIRSNLVTDATVNSIANQAGGGPSRNTGQTNLTNNKKRTAIQI